MPRHGHGPRAVAGPNPHVTMAYGPGFDGEPLLDQPIHWTIEDISLVDSQRGKGQVELEH